MSTTSHHHTCCRAVLPLILALLLASLPPAPEPMGLLTARAAVDPLPIGWTSTEGGGTRSVAWGDVDGDGDLDLAVGNDSANRLYRNDGGMLTTSAVWSSVDGGANSVAWGDVDGDGDLDLAADTRLYRNDGGTLTTSAVWSATDGGGSSVAWGDVDGDGDLDLAVGNGGRPSPPNRLYRNDGGTLSATAVWSSSQGGANSVAWGDVDGDGDLDLAVGNDYQPNRLYRNESGTLTASTVWSASFGTDARSIAWGDVDGDGDLDLAADTRLYRNDGGTLTTSAVWSATETDETYAVAWGDVDGDGDLDLAVGNANQSRLYRNDGGTLTTSAVWSSTDGGASSVAWGDVDGDGDLDLAVGNNSQPNRLYRNDGGTLTASTVWSSNEIDSTTSVAWGDVDGDGDLDLAVGNGLNDESLFSRLYRNEQGTLTASAVWSSTDTDDIRSIAWGDVDGDGDLDLAVGSWARPIQLYRNGTAGLARLPSSNPTIGIIRPGSISRADFYAVSQTQRNRFISIPYTLADLDGRPVRRLRSEYSLDGGGNWQPAVAASGTLTSNLTTSPSGVAHTFTWDTFASSVFGQSDNVVVRLVAYPSLTTGPNGTPIFLRPYASATTFPFRVRGTQVRVISNARPGGELGAIVYRLPKGHTGGAQPLASGGQPFHTDGHGYLQGRGQLALSDQLIALQPVVVPDTYTLYYTSATPTAAGLSATAVFTPGVQTLTVSPANPLLLFNLDVSLEWDARKDTQFLSQLQYDLKRTSELLYDWSNGQAALGRITLYHDKQKWNDAHLRIYATNRMRPNAVQGGIVSDIVSDPGSPAITYAPGQVRVGPSWNRYGDPGSSLGEDWPRALAHELGHYALFLDDNYLGLDAHGLLVPVDSCPGAMSDPYRDDYSEFHPAANWAAECGGTLSNQSTGRADWSTITAFYPWLHAPSTAFSQVLAGPATLPLEVTQIQQASIITPSTTVDTPIFLLSQNGQRVQPGASARDFLFQDTDDPDTAPDRLIDLGKPTLDQVLARGARAGDRLCVLELNATRLGCTTISASDRQLALHTTSNWQPDLTITPVTSRTLALDVQGAPAGLALQAQLYPLNDSALPAIALTRTPSGSYTGTLTSPTDRVPPLEGYVHVWVNEAEPRREVVADYALRGNPGNKWARAPRGSPGNKWARAPIISSDGQVIVFGDDLSFPEGSFYTLQVASALPAAPSWVTTVGQAYRLSASPTAPALRGTSISFNYLGSEVPPGEETGLRVYYWNGSSWQQLVTALDLYHNTASAPAQGPGIYALMSSVMLPLDHAGWNLVAYPAPGKQPLPAALASIDGHYTTVYGFDPTDTANPWKAYDAGVEPQWAPLVDDLKQLEYGHGYWINVTEPTTALLKGGTAASLVAQNSINTLSLPPATYYGIVPGINPTRQLQVQAHVNGHLCGEATTQSLAIDGKLQAVFVVDVRAAGAGADAGCGTLGQPVAIAFLDSGRQVQQTMTSWDNDRVHKLLIGTTRVYLPTIVRQANR